MTDLTVFGTAPLGELIDILARRPADERQVRFSDGSVPSGLTSYRGYYDHLAITPATDRTEIVCNLLAWLLYADGKEFTDYKGGVYRMDRSTPVWCSPYGEASGLAIVGVSESNGVVTLSTCSIDDFEDCPVAL